MASYFLRRESHMRAQVRRREEWRGSALTSSSIECYSPVYQVFGHNGQRMGGGEKIKPSLRVSFAQGRYRRRGQYQIADIRQLHQEKALTRHRIRCRSHTAILSDCRATCVSAFA